MRTAATPPPAPAEPERKSEPHGWAQGRDVAIKYLNWNGEQDELESLQKELVVMSRLKVRAPLLRFTIIDGMGGTA